MRENLRAPPWKLVLQWGRQFRMDRVAIKDVSEKLSLRHALGKKTLSLKINIPSKNIIIFFKVRILVNFQTLACGKKQHQLRLSHPFSPKAT